MCRAWPSVGPSAAGVSPPVAVRGAARCTFASRCKVRAGLVLSVKMEDRKEVGRWGWEESHHRPCGGAPRELSPC